MASVLPVRKSMIIVFTIAAACGWYLTYLAYRGMFVNEPYNQYTSFCAWFSWLIVPYTVLITIFALGTAVDRLGLQWMVDWFWNHM